MSKDHAELNPGGGGGMNKIKVNGRSYWFDRLTNLKRISKSKWTIERHDLTFTIEGGRHAGGTSRNWWVDGPLFTGSIECTSLVDCLNLLENM